MTDPTPFATTVDLEARWRPLSPTEQTRAAILLEDASAVIRARCRGIDRRIADGLLDATVPKRTVCSMVQRVMQAAADGAGISQESRTAGPFAFSQSFVNPSGDMYLTKAERIDLGYLGQRLSAINLATGKAVT